MIGSNLCSPALLYLVLGILTIISMIMFKSDAKTVALKAIIIFIWTWVLNYICKLGHEGISWFLVILPFVIMAIFLVIMSNIIAKLTVDEIRQISVDETRNQY